jgi:hypothetical protein
MVDRAFSDDFSVVPRLHGAGRVIHSRRIDICRPSISHPDQDETREEITRMTPSTAIPSVSHILPQGERSPDLKAPRPVSRI